MKIKLADAFDLQMGKTPARANDEYWDNGTNCWVSISDLSSCGKYIESTKEAITDLAVIESGIKPVPENTVIMSFKLSLGKTAITKEKIYTNEAIMAFIPNGKYEILPNYIYHLFSGKDWTQGTNRAVMGATLNKATLSEVEVEVPNICEQQKAVSIFDKMDELISCRKEQLSKLDELVKARFVEMFGDPMTNSGGYELKTYGELFELNAGGTPSKQKTEYWENGTISWIGSNMCQNAVIYKNDGNYITEEGLKHSSAKMFPVDTVLIALVGATIGKTAILKFETTTNQNVLGIRGIKENGYTPEFVFYYTQGLYKRFINIGDGGFAMASKGFISELPFPIVDLSYQKDFSKFVNQTEKTKAEVQKSLDELEILKKSLMQKYFG